jgi:hypothetical protein
MNVKQRNTRAAWAVGLVIVISLWAGSRASMADEVTDWNAAALDILYTGGQNPVLQTWSMAMVHLAIHDALNAIDRRHAPYAFDGRAPSGASPQAAVAAAAHDVLVAAIPAVFPGTIPAATLPSPGFGNPSQRAAGVAAADAAYAAALAAIPDGPAKTNGVAVGRAAAAALLTRRRADGATAVVPYTPGTAPGQWQPTPNPVPPDPSTGGPGLAPALLPGWGNVTPFALTSGAQFRPAGPPALTSEEYARDYNEVKSLGEKASTARSAEQSSIARFWYEGSVAGWNRIARVVAAPSNLTAWGNARLFALLNVAMADGFIAGWDARYVYNFWRPVTAIRAGDIDGNEKTTADPNWQSFLNTPNIPDYPSTHSVLGGAAAEVLAWFFGNDRIAFTTTSGAPFGTTPESGAPFAGLTRSFTSFSQAAQENADSRVYAGIHFRSAVRDGVLQGRSIGALVVEQYLK